ncbi:MAG: hypothetical protein LUH21_14060 [Clostridiales bacterium]|nr:hypothetical protein [Clostridiales bacterium]
MIQKAKDCRMVLEQCRDYAVIAGALNESMTAYFEEQLKQYLNLDMPEISDIYLQNVPPVVCWYEGMISTEDLLDTYGIQHRKDIRKMNKKATSGVPSLALPNFCSKSREERKL